MHSGARRGVRRWRLGTATSGLSDTTKPRGRTTRGVFMGTASVFVVRGERDDDRESRNLLTSRDAGQGDVHVVDLDAKLADRAKCGELSEQAVGRRSAPSGCDRPGLVSRGIRESTTSQRREGRPDGVPPASLAPRARVRGTRRTPPRALAHARARRGAGRRGFKAGAAQRPSTVDPARSRVSSATRPAAAAGGRSPGPQLFITSVGRATPRTTSARRGVSVAAADARAATWPPPGRAPRPRPRRRRPQPARDTVRRATRPPALRASGGPSWTRVWRWPSASASARSARKRRRTNLGRRWRSRRTRSTARRRRDAAAAAGARADRAEGESASLRASPSSRRRCARGRGT